MHDAAIVRVSNRVRDLKPVAHCLFNSETAARNQFVQSTAFDQLHCDIRLAVKFAHFVNRADMGMTQRGRRSGFTQQTSPGIVIAGRSRGKDFNCDVSFQLLVASAIHFAHPARADPLDDAIVAKLLATGEDGFDVLIQFAAPVFCL